MGRSEVCDDGERMDERCLGGASVMEARIISMAYNKIIYFPVAIFQH